MQLLTQKVISLLLQKQMIPSVMEKPHATIPFMSNVFPNGFLKVPLVHVVEKT